MWKIYNEDKIEVLKKTQENLEASQKNNQMLLDVLQNIVDVTHKEESVVERTEEEKKLAAYALNLCTVSVSQIIDYNDIQFLEYEYDAILNNLNLEKMPKDEALLRILKQLLDVITFFRIQEGDRQMMEKEYEQRIKDAIWSAIPNPTMMVTGGSALSIGLALASQVGIGYMNYRKEKAKITQDKERSKWELQRSAMEQFNGLRRELFDTAWRLADEYNFPDEYRITERQISQYNSILLDTDDLRRYERLEYISKNFKAYPPFWYYIGNAANAVFLDERYSVSVREKYKKLATENFRYFFELTEHNLLREDQLVASCALELFDLIDDKEEKLQLLEKAISVSGNAFDVLQICAVSYLKIGEINKACELLKMLVNEEYNKMLNAQLLSRLYVSKVIDGDDSYVDEYEMLSMRFSQIEYLFPLPKEVPENDEEKEQLADSFIQKQKENLKINYACTMKRYVTVCENRYYEICRVNGNITSEIAELIKDVSDSIGMLVGKDEKTFFLEKIKNAVNNNGVFKRMIEDGDSRIKGKVQVAFVDIFGSAFSYIAKTISSKIDRIYDMSEISVLENELYTFMGEKEIIGNKPHVRNSDCDAIEEIFGDEFLQDLEKSKAVDRFISVIHDNGYTLQSLTKKEVDNIEFTLRGDSKFKPYLERNVKRFNMLADEDNIVAIINDKSASNIDLIFTTNLVIVTTWFKVDACLYRYVNVDRSGEKLVIGNYKYYNDNIHISKLHDMIKRFAELSNDNLQGTTRALSTEIYNTILTGKEQEPTEKEVDRVVASVAIGAARRFPFFL